MPESQRPALHPQTTPAFPPDRNSRRTASPALPLPSPTYKKGQARKPAL